MDKIHELDCCDMGTQILDDPPRNKSYHENLIHADKLMNGALEFLEWASTHFEFPALSSNDQAIKLHFHVLI